MGTPSNKDNLKPQQIISNTTSSESSQTITQDNNAEPEPERADKITASDSPVNSTFDE